MVSRSLAGVFLAAAVGFAAVNCGGDGSPKGPGPSCSVSIAPPTQAIGADGGPATVTVTAPGGCAWTAASGASWVTVTSGASGTGNGSVAYTVAANAATAARTTTLSIGTQTHTVTQQGRPAVECTYALQPASADLTKDAASGTFAVRAPAGCAWTATSTAPWLLVSSGGTGSGDGSVTYAVTRNTEIGGRTGTITVAGQVFTLRQQGDVGVCQYSVTPVSFDPCMPATTMRVTLTTDAACPWTAAPTSSWLGVSQSGGSGSATLDVSVGDNYDAPRNGVVEIRWPTATAGQNVHVSQAGCVYAVSQGTFTFPVAGGSATFDVLQQSIPTVCGGALQDRCVWSAVADVPWITITSSMPRSGDNPVAFTVAANTSDATRTGRITVRDRVVLITQTP